MISQLFRNGANGADGALAFLRDLGKALSVMSETLKKALIESIGADSPWHLMFCSLAALLLLAGYVVGRRLGYKAGFRAGRGEAFEIGRNWLKSAPKSTTRGNIRRDAI